jgi:tRNA pseudouridine38-40 synthase
MGVMPGARGAMRNLKLTIEFDGSAYAGWQYQPNRPTIQGAVESAVHKLLGEKVTVYGCGRTDSGVSARAYVANFHTAKTGTVPQRVLRAAGDTSATCLSRRSVDVSPPRDCPMFSMSAERLRLALNHFLPGDIHILSVEDVEPGFHARHSARGKTYVYRIVRGESPLRRNQAWEFWFKLDPEKMRRAAPLFEGQRDFRPFCQTKDKDGTCHVRRVRVGAGHERIVLDSYRVPSPPDEVLVVVAGDRFLYKMVRRIVGALVACGSGRLTQKDIRAALAGRPYPPFQTAPACGLLLHSVRY